MFTRRYSWNLPIKFTEVITPQEYMENKNCKIIVGWVKQPWRNRQEPNFIEETKNSQAVWKRLGPAGPPGEETPVCDVYLMFPGFVSCPSCWCELWWCSCLCGIPAPVNNSLPIFLLIIQIKLIAKLVVSESKVM